MQYSQERLDFNQQLRAVAKQKEAHNWGDESPENRAKSLELIRKHSDLETVVNNLAPRYEVGDGISECLYSDVNPYTVVDVSKNGKRIKVRACKAELADGWKPEFIPGGFSAHCTNQSEQKWNIEEDEEGRVVELSLRRVKFKNPNLPATHRECWVPVGSSPNTVCWVAGHRKFHDYNF